MAIPKYDLNAPPLETGRFCVVYADPVSRKSTEGVVELVGLGQLGDKAGYEKWRVKFVNGGYPCLRWVHQFDLILTPSLPVEMASAMKGGSLAN